MMTAGINNLGRRTPKPGPRMWPQFDRRSFVGCRAGDSRDDAAAQSVRQSRPVWHSRRRRVPRGQDSTPREGGIRRCRHLPHLTPWHPAQQCPRPNRSIFPPQRRVLWASGACCKKPMAGHQRPRRTGRVLQRCVCSAPANHGRRCDQFGNHKWGRGGNTAHPRIRRLHLRDPRCQRLSTRGP